MDCKVVFSGQADLDLESIVRFLAQKNAAAAERLGYALIDDALSLGNRSLPISQRNGLRLPEKR